MGLKEMLETLKEWLTPRRYAPYRLHAAGHMGSLVIDAPRPVSDLAGCRRIVHFGDGYVSEPKQKH